MKVLICTSSRTEHIGSHCADHYPLLFKKIFEALGHSAEFAGPNIAGDPFRARISEFDVAFFWGLESYVFYPEYAESLLNEFKGKKVLYITVARNEALFKKFDIIVGADVPSYKSFYTRHCPRARVELLPFASPMFDWVDLDKTDPYCGAEHPRLVYTGLMTQRQLSCFYALAQAGYVLHVGGKFLPEEGTSRPFTLAEVKGLHPNIRLIAPYGRFPYGAHWPWLRYADLALNVYPSRVGNAVSSKLVDYLVCGLPVVSEESAPNNFYLRAYNAGLTCRWNDPADMVAKVKQALSMKWDRESIRAKARKAFDPLSVGKAIMKLVCDRN